MKRKAISVLLAAMMVTTLAVGCGNKGGGSDDSSDKGSSDSGSDLITVGFSQVGAESDWRTANSESMKETFSKDNGYKLIFDDAQQKQENQITAIRNFIQQDVDYIVLAPVTETGWDTVLKEAQDADIPVIIVDRMVDVSDDSLYTAWVGSDFKLEGQKASAWLKAYAEAKGNVRSQYRPHPGNHRSICSDRTYRRSGRGCKRKLDGISLTSRPENLHRQRTGSYGVYAEKA